MTANAKDDQVARMVAAVTRAGLTVYGVTIEPRRIHIATQPLGETAPSVDDADAWLVANGPNKAPRRE